MKRARKGKSLGETKDNSQTILLVLSNLREMDWIHTSIDCASANFRTIVVGFYPSEPTWFNGLNSDKVTVVNFSMTSPKSIIRQVYRMFRLLRRVQPELVIAHGFYASLISVFSKRCKSGLRVITARHHGSGHYNNLLFKNLDNLISKLSYKIIAISLLTEQLLLSEGVSSQKIIKISNGIDLKIYQEKPLYERNLTRMKWGYDSSHFIVAMVSRFVDWKGVEICVDAFLNLAKDFPDARIIFANSSGSISAIDTKLAQLPKEVYRRDITLEDMPSFYKSVDALVHIPVRPSAEPFGLVYLEALMSQVPTVFTRSGVLLEIPNIGDHSFIVDYQNAIDVEIALRQIRHGERKPVLSNAQLESYSLLKYAENFNQMLTVELKRASK